MKTRALQWMLVVALPVVVIGGALALNRDRTQRNYEWPTQMEQSPAYRSQSTNPVLRLGMTEQMPVAGTIARGHEVFPYGADTAEAMRAGRELVNPYQPTPQNLARGQWIFQNYCLVCHGVAGNGDGPIIPKYPNPPSFHSATSRALADGTLFHVITMGRNNMPSHGPLVSVVDRWKVVLYIRSLQAKDLKDIKDIRDIKDK